MSQRIYTGGRRAKRLPPGIRIMIYVPNENAKLVEDARAALRKDGVSLSAAMVEGLALYMQGRCPQ